MLKVIVNDDGVDQMEIAIKIGKQLNLDMGRGYMGFLQFSAGSNYAVDFLNWHMLGNNLYNSA